MPAAGCAFAYARVFASALANGAGAGALPARGVPARAVRGGGGGRDVHSHILGAYSQLHTRMDARRYVNMWLVAAAAAAWGTAIAVTLLACACPCVTALFYFRGELYAARAMRDMHAAYRRPHFMCRPLCVHVTDCICIWLSCMAPTPHVQTAVRPVTGAGTSAR